MVASFKDFPAPDYSSCTLPLPLPSGHSLHSLFSYSLQQGLTAWGDQEEKEGLAIRDALSSLAPPSLHNSPELKEAMFPSGGWARVGPGKRTGARRGRAGEAPKGTEAGVVAGGPLGASGASGAGARS